MAGAALASKTVPSNSAPWANKAMNAVTTAGRVLSVAGAVREAGMAALRRAADPGAARAVAWPADFKEALRAAAGSRLQGGGGGGAAAGLMR